jgi:K+-sensing histidine kinase KdpD
MLEAEGYQVFAAENGLRGLELARKCLPALIICDIMMPGMDGYEVLANLHRSPETATIPFIFLTAKADMTALRQGMELGADDYLTKPFSIDQLLAAIQVRLKKQEALARQHQAELNEAESKLFDLLQYQDLNELDQIARHLNATAIMIYRPHFNGDDLRLEATTGYPPESTAHNALFGLSPLRQVFYRKQAAYYKSDSQQHLAYLPLVQRDEVLGVLAIALQPGLDSQNTEMLEADTQRQLFIVATQLARSLDQARLIEETSQIPQLRQSNELKSTLLASVSHDLRTPLTSIKTAVAGLRDDEIQLTPQEQQEYLQTIETEVDRLDQLISKVLNLSRIEAGLLRPEKGLFFLPEIINELVDRLARTPVLNNRPVITQFEAELPLVPVDYVLIEQVLANLIENAAKYSGANRPITIGVSQISRLDLEKHRVPGKVGPASANGVEPKQLGVMVTVSDEGTGIPQTDLEQIFVKFYRVTPHDTSYSAVKGTGLGLAICKGIIEAHDGLVWATSQINRGSTLAFWLPL